LSVGARKPSVKSVQDTMFKNLGKYGTYGNTSEIIAGY